MEKVRPGLWSIRVPLPGVPRHVLVYVFETDAGPYLVDSGMDTPEGRAGLEAGLAELGTSVDEVRGVLMTHAHLDHYGLSGWIRERSGAWTALHPADLPAIEDFERPPAERIGAAMTRAGAPPELIEEVTGRALRTGWSFPRPDLLVEDGQRPPIPGWDLRAIWTPGHSPGHLCFWEPRENLLLSGDHVLPTITATLPASSDHEPDPLTASLASLDKLSGLPAAEVLPAHEHRFTDLEPRLAEIRAHHESRASRTLAAVPAHPATAWEIAQATRPRPLSETRAFTVLVVLSDLFARLTALTSRGALRQHPGTPARWSRTET